MPVPDGVAPYQAKLVFVASLYSAISLSPFESASTDKLRLSNSEKVTGNVIVYEDEFCPAYPHCIGYSGDIIED